MKRALGLPSKSIVHNWNQAGMREIPGYAIHYDRLASGGRYAKAGGYLSIGMDVSISGMRIHEACTYGDEEACEQVRCKEGGRLAGSVVGGGIGGLLLCGVAGMTTGPGGLACALVMGGAGSTADGAAIGSYGELSCSNQ